MKKLNYLLLLLLLSVSTLVKGQSNYYFDKNKEFTISLPGEEIYYEKFLSPKDGRLVSETLYSDDFEVELSVYKGKSYNYLDDVDFTQELESFAKIMEYSEIRKFSKGRLSSEMNYEFYIGYDSKYKHNVVFGFVQNSFSRIIYEVELSCININLETSKNIINSITIE